MSKGNEKIHAFKEVMSDPKKRAILSLSFYFIFFLVIIIMIRLHPVEYALPKTALEKWGEKSEYDFLYTFYSEKETLVLKGNFKDGESAFEIEEQKYKTENRKFYLEDSMEEYQFENTFIEMVFFDIHADTILNWIEKGTLEYTSTYADGTMKKNYQIPKEEFDKWEGNIESDLFSLAVYEKENTLIKIEIEAQKEKVQMEIMDKK